MVIRNGFTPFLLTTDRKSIEKWLQKYTTILVEVVEPCAAAQQLRYFFGKFIHPNGVPKRVTLDRRGIFSGKKYYKPEETLQLIMRYGYFIDEPRYRNRIRRCDGELYDEIVEYVVNLKMSPPLKELLDELCPIENCTHIPLT